MRSWRRQPSAHGPCARPWPVHQHDVGKAEDGEIVVHAGLVALEQTVGLVLPLAHGSAHVERAAVGIGFFGNLGADGEGAVGAAELAVEPCFGAARVGFIVGREEVGLRDEAVPPGGGDVVELAQLLVEREDEDDEIVVVRLGVDRAVRDDEDVFARRLVLDGEVGRVIGLDAVVPRVHDGQARLFGLVPHGLPDPLFGVEVHFGQQRVGHALRDVAVVGSRGNLFEEADVVEDFALDEAEDELAVFLLGIVLVGRVDREGDVAPAVDGQHVEIVAQDTHLGQNLGLAVEFERIVLYFVEHVVAGGDAVETIVPTHAHELVGGGVGVPLQLGVTRVDPVVDAVLGGGQLVARLDVERPETLLRTVGLQHVVGPGGVDAQALLGGEEILFLDVGVDLLAQVGAGREEETRRQE